MTTEDYNGHKFHTGTGSQERMFAEADKKGHKFFVAKDTAYTDSVGDGMIGKAYASFPSIEEFCDSYYYPRHQGKWWLYELIREDTPCRLYFDVDGDTRPVAEVQKDIENAAKLIASWRKGTVEEVVVAESTKGKKRGLHFVVHGLHYRSNVEQKEDVEKAVEALKLANIDIKVYTRNRLFRLPYSTKINEIRPLIPVGSWDVEDFIVGIQGQ